MIRATEEDAMMKHYILTHPEHFPEPKKVAALPHKVALYIFATHSFKVKYLDKLEPWVPVRW